MDATELRLRMAMRSPTAGPAPKPTRKAKKKVKAVSEQRAYSPRQLAIRQYGSYTAALAGVELRARATALADAMRAVGRVGR